MMRASPYCVYTIGHSTRTLEAFIGLVTARDIELLVDVRRWPSSKRYPHFKKESLQLSLRTVGIDYLWRSDLGGFRKPLPDSINTGWKVGAFRAYADFMLTPDFEKIMEEMEVIATHRRAVIMCAEAIPWRCHRQLLADAFLVRGWNVRHITDEGCGEHRLTPFAQTEEKRIVYRGML